MFYRLFTAVLPAAFFIISVAQTHDLPEKCRELGNKDVYIYLLNNVLGSKAFIKYANEIPCNHKLDLQSNGNEACQFVENIVDDEAADKEDSPLIQSLSPDIRAAFSTMIRAVYNVPVKSKGDSHYAQISGVMSFFSDINVGMSVTGSYQSITSVFNEIGAGAKSTCPAESCAPSTSSTRLCPLPTYGPLTVTIPAPLTVTLTNRSKNATSTPASVPQKSHHKVTTMPSVLKSSSSPSTAFLNTSSPFSPEPTVTSGSQHENFGSKIASYPFGSTSIGVWAVIILGIFGVAVFL